MTNSLRQGGNYYDQRSNNNKSKNKLDLNANKYPKGYLPVFSIVIIQIIILTIALVGIGQKWYVVSIQWYDAFLITFIIGFCLNSIWLILRQNFGMSSKYSVKKTKDFFKSKLQRKHEKEINSLSLNNTMTLEEFIEFNQERKKETQKIFWISFWIQFSLMIISIIIELIFIYAIS